MPSPDATDQPAELLAKGASAVGFDWRVPVLLIAYAALLATGSMFHEPWADEAQSWLMARDNSLWELASSELRVFGHPILWYVVLNVPCQLGTPYAASLAFLGWLSAVVGAWILLRHAPWPFWLRGLAIFSFFLAYQYAVVVRSYCLLPPLLFAAAACYPTRTSRPWRYVLLLILLSHVSAHGALLSLGLITEWLWSVVRTWGAAGSGIRRSQIASAFLFAVSGILLLLIVWPTRSNPVLTEKAAVTPSGFAYGLLLLADRSLAAQPVVSALALIVSLCWFWKRKVLALFLLLYLPLLAFMSGVYAAPWHEGMPFLAWIFVAWISCLPKVSHDSNDAPCQFASPWGKVMLGAMAAVMLFQLHATCASYAFDLGQPYCASRAVATELQQQAEPGDTLFIRGYHAIAVIPYLKDVTVVNSNLPSGKTYDRFGNYDGSLEAFERLQPDWVVAEIPKNMPLSTRPGVLFDLPPPPSGYEAKLFPGVLFYRTEPAGWLSFVLMRRVGHPQE